MAELTPDEIALWDRFYAARRQLDRALDQHLQQNASVSASEFVILRALAQADGRRLRVRDIVDVVNWEQSRVSHQVGRMEARRLVRREPDANDGRTAWVVLTDFGLSCALDAMPDRADRLHSYFFGILSDEERALIGDISGRILDAIDRGRAGRDPGAGDSAEAQPSS